MSDESTIDCPWMQRALELAGVAESSGEVPVGAVVVLGDDIIGEGFNQQISANDPTAHAEIVALRAAAQYVANYRLPSARLYVTLEPCSMCCGAMIHARIQEVVFAATEPRAGAIVSARQLLDEGSFNHRVAWRQDAAYTEASSQLLKRFFRARR